MVVCSVESPTGGSEEVKCNVTQRRRGVLRLPHHTLLAELCTKWSGKPRSPNNLVGLEEAPRICCTLSMFPSSALAETSSTPYADAGGLVASFYGWPSPFPCCALVFPKVKLPCQQRQCVCAAVFQFLTSHAGHGAVVVDVLWRVSLRVSLVVVFKAIHLGHVINLFRGLRCSRLVTSQQLSLRTDTSRGVLCWE